MASTQAGTPHLLAGAIVIGLTALLLSIGRLAVIHLEHENVHTFAPRVFQFKNQGLAFQRAAVSAPDVLPLYGSSELANPVPERAGVFFRSEPTGFQVSPVGKVGSSPLIMLQELAALDGDLHGKKIAISLSAVWFLAPDLTPFWYEGNFSLFTASELVFGSALDFRLKREIASRMLHFPRPLAKSPLLEFALRRLASEGWIDHIAFWALWPLGKLQNAVLDLQDHFEALIYILRQPKSASALHAERLTWPSLITKASEKAMADEKQNANAAGTDTQTVPHRSEAWFHERLDQSAEWTDLELLLRVLTEIRSEPLLLSMPMDGQFYDQIGISRSIRESYYEKMRALAQRYNFPLVEFEQHDEDATFLEHRVPRIKHIPAAHLTGKGWMFYDRALDDFFHNRIPRT
jgi:D-alanine transfer protein